MQCFPDEDEALILSYQIFQIKKIVEVISKEKYSIELEEVETKSILNEIRTPKQFGTANMQTQPKPLNLDTLKQDPDQHIQILMEQQKEVEKKKDQALEDFKTEAKNFVEKGQLKEFKVNDI